MKTILYALVWGLSLSMVAISPELAWSAVKEQATAYISKIDGKGAAKVRRKSGSESIAGDKQHLFMGDKITTDAQTTVEIMLLDGTLVRVGLNTEYRLEAVKEKDGIMTWAFQLAKGSIRALVEKSPNKKTVKFRVNTPVGTMGVRGTELVLDHVVTAKRTTLHTIEGVVEFGFKKCELTKSCILVKTGEMASVTEGGPAPKAVKADAAALLFMGIGSKGAQAGGNSGEGGDGAGGSGKLTAEELEALRARMALFDSVKAAEGFAQNSANGVNVKDLGSVDALLQKASEAMASAQDSLIGRTAAEREAAYKAMADGTYADRLKIADGVDNASRSRAGSQAYRDKENMSATRAAAKLKVADAILDSKKIKIIAEETDPVEEIIRKKIAAALALLDEARKRRPVNPAPTPIDNSGDSGGVVGGDAPDSVGPDTTAPTPPDGLISEGKVEVTYEEYRDLVRCDGHSHNNNCKEVVKIGKDWYDWDNMGGEGTMWAHKGNKIETSTNVVAEAGICYNEQKKCGKEYIPCSRSEMIDGKFCKAKFTEYKCTVISRTPTKCPKTSTAP